MNTPRNQVMTLALTVPLAVAHMASAQNTLPGQTAQTAQSEQRAASPNAPQKSLELVIMGTTDIHCNVISYDYYKDTPVDHYGLSRVATLVKEVRAKHPDALLMDAGDLIQGNPMGDFLAKVKPVAKAQVHAVYKAMNLMKYDVATLGNHEFNYGLEFLQNTLKGASFPYVSANILKHRTDQKAEAAKPLVAPFVILNRKIQGESVKIAVMGFAPPQITMWDKDKLEGRIQTLDIVAAAKDTLLEIKNKGGADIVVAVAHSGINPLPYENMTENASYHLAALEGVDVVLTGHSHMEFPGKKFAGQEALGIDPSKGTIKGKPVVMPGYWASHLGVVTLKLERKNNRWVPTEGRSELRSAKGVAEDPAVVKATATDHAATLAFVRQTVGTFKAPVQTYFARLHDTAAVQLVNEAQTWFVKRELKGTRYERLPVLSAAAPFKAGFGGEYTDIPAGPVAIKHFADLYVYPNTLKAVLLKGRQVKDWLETSAGNFSQVDPTKSGELNIINDRFRSYNFDVIDGVTFGIDITLPEGNRIFDLSFQGKPIAPDDEFVVATNNYRATGGGSFPHLKGDNIILDSTVENREALVQYIKERKSLAAKAHNNWFIKPIKGNKSTLIFETALEALPFAPTWAKLHSKDEKTKVARFVLDLENGTSVTKAP